MIGESLSDIKGANAAGNAWEDAAGSTPMSCENGLNGFPASNSVEIDAKSRKSDANGA